MTTGDGDQREEYADASTPTARCRGHPVLTIACGSASGHAGWTIIPGQGLGPVMLGMTDIEAHMYLDAPTAVKTSGYAKHEDSGALSLPYERTAATSPYRLTAIDVGAGRYRTPQDIRIGSSICDVVKACGDTAASVTLDGARVVRCLDISSDAGTTGAALHLVFAYANRGITLTMRASDGAPDAFEVRSIRIFAPVRCKAI